MDDLISRQGAIDEVHEAIYEFFDICDDDEESPITYKDEKLLEINKAITTRIKQFPSAQPEPKWIPCSERLPKEEDGRVLITLDGEVTTATYSEFSKTWYIGDMCGVSDRVPTAWMPRPKPYRSK